MKRGFLLSIVSAVAVFGMITMASAGSVDWQYLTDPSAVNKGPGLDGLMGTGDDSADANNTPGALSSATITWGVSDPPCPLAQSISYYTGIEVDCLGTPTTGENTATYLTVLQTETIPDTGTATIKLTPGGGPNTGDNCGLGAVHSTKDTTLYMSVAGIPAAIPLGVSPSDGMVYDADVQITTNWTCPANSIVHQATYLDSIRQLLPAAAEGFMVSCSSLTMAAPGIPCLDGAVTDGLSFLWTDDDPEDCATACCDDDGDDYEDTACSGGTDCLDTNPAVHPGAVEICGNGLDDDCLGDDEACPGPCAGGAAE
jgi:hypothetical protein